MIPDIFHFCNGLTEDFGSKSYSLVNYLAVTSAFEFNKPVKICFYYSYELQGEWWERTKILVELIKVDPPSEIFGNSLMHISHKADILRLDVLL